MAASHSEIRNILGVIAAATLPMTEMALATVVDVEGSSYRRTGARMLILQNGHWTGTISGGCLEGNALRRAREVMRTQIPQLATYDTRTDDDAKALGASLGCNGIIQVWIEPMTAVVVEGLHILQAAFLGHVAAWFARPLKMDAGAPFSLMGEQDAGWSMSIPLRYEEGLQSHLLADGEVLFAVEQVQPALRLLIFGGGDDARPLCQLAAQMGWRVTVTDDCKAKALPLRFPEAEHVLQLDRNIAADALQPNAYTAAVLLSHNYAYDLAIVAGLLPFALPYIGILGPRKRFERMDAELGGLLRDLAAVHAPIGLDIGAQTPFEIALAIVTEVQAVLAARPAGFLKARESYIHHRKQLQP